MRLHSIALLPVAGLIWFGAHLLSSQQPAQQDNGEFRESMVAIDLDSPAGRAREAAFAKLAAQGQHKVGAAGGNNICRFVFSPQLGVVCTPSDDLFNKGVTDNTTWATLDVVVWARNSWVAAHGGEAPAMARLRAAMGYANRLYAQSDTKIQLRVVEVLRLGDDAIPDSDVALVASQRGADMFLILSDVGDRLNNLGCTRNQCGRATVNGYFERASSQGTTYLRPIDSASTISWVYDVVGESGTMNAAGEVLANASIATLGEIVAHELGHNMGLAHQIEAPGTPPHLPYGRGFQSLGASDIMAGVGGYYFSNPRLACVDGKPCGVENTTDAARAAKETRFEIAAVSPSSKRVSGSFTGLWWTATENGTGWTINHQDDTLFVVWYTYDLTGQPLWLLSSGLRRQADDSFQGPMYRVRRGLPFNRTNGGPAINSSDIEEIGNVSISFNDSDWGQASFDITLDGRVYRSSKWLVRQHFQVAFPQCVASATGREGATNYQDLWWNPSEPGWGLNVAHEAATIFGAWFTYDANMRPIWRVASGMERQADGTYTGAIYALTGLPLDEIGGTVFSRGWVSETNDARKVRNAFAGSPSIAGLATLRFTDGANGSMTYTGDGVNVTKSITRQVFGATPALCQ